MNEEISQESSFLDVVAYCNDYRESLLSLENKVKILVSDLKSQNISWDKWEQIAQAMLSLRHIEDARMRLWKVIQYNDDWISKYDK